MSDPGPRPKNIGVREKPGAWFLAHEPCSQVHRPGFEAATIHCWPPALLQSEEQEGEEAEEGLN